MHIGRQLEQPLKQLREPYKGRGSFNVLRKDSSFVPMFTLLNKYATQTPKNSGQFAIVKTF